MKYHTKDLVDFEYLYSLICKHKNNALSYSDIVSSFKEYFLFGYEIFEDNQRVGVVFALKVGEMYSVDGYNESGSIFSASKAGKKVAKRLLKDYTEVIYTSHNICDKASTALTKRIGFKEHAIILRMLKDGN